MIEPSVWFTQSDYWENKDSEAGNYGLSGQAGTQKLADAIIDSLQSAPARVNPEKREQQHAPYP